MPRLAQISDWTEVRDLRMRALAEAPEAFAQSLADAVLLTDEQWKERLEPTHERAWFVEETPSGEFVGTAVGFLDPDARLAYLGGMWVAPEHRRLGIGRTLIEHVEFWARERGATRIELEVNAATLAAVRLYESCGYESTGGTRPLPSDPSATVIELAKTIIP